VFYNLFPIFLVILISDSTLRRLLYKLEDNLMLSFIHAFMRSGLYPFFFDTISIGFQYVTLGISHYFVYLVKSRLLMLDLQQLQISYTTMWIYLISKSKPLNRMQYTVVARALIFLVKVLIQLGRQF